jgi:hypothetical protein
MRTLLEALVEGEKLGELCDNFGGDSVGDIDQLIQDIVGVADI